MKFTIRNNAKISNKYLRFAKWKIRGLNQKFGQLLYSEIYVNKIASNPTQYDVTVKMGVPGPDIVISARSNNLKELWSSLSKKMKRQLRKTKESKLQRSLVFIGYLFCLSACNFDKTEPPQPVDPQYSQADILHYSGLSKIEQQALSPDQAISSLKNGNASFLKKKITARDHSENERTTSSEQFPVATVLSCFDSRIPVEDIFNKGIGDLLVLRVAGNVINPDILGSMEYGAEDLGSRVIVVLGHTNCTSVNKAIDDENLAM